MAENQNEQESSEEEAAEPKKGKGKVLLFAIIGLVVVLFSSFLGAYFGGAFSSAEEEGEGAEMKKPPPIVEVVNETMKINALTVQLADPGRKRKILRLSLTIGIFKPETPPEAENPISDEALDPMLKDRMLGVLGGKTSDEIGSPDGREALKQEILRELASVYPPERGKVIEIYFTEFLIQ